MPPKRKSSLGRKKPDAKRKKEERARETPEETESRRVMNLAQTTAARASETPEQTATRRSRDTSCHKGAKDAKWAFMNRAAFNYDPKENFADHDLINIGRMSIVCKHCQALKWEGETDGMCCSNGKVKLPELSFPIEPLKSLLLGDSANAKHFKENLRKYNSSFQMTSFGATEIREPGYMPTFKIQGQIYHQIDSLLPQPNEEHKFLQIFFMNNGQVEAKRRCEIIPGIKPNIVHELQQMLHQHNAYIKSFKTALEKMPRDEYKIVIKADQVPTGEHERRFNAPIVNEG
jgi:hypothetical protein